jgi:hypothetical protein
VKKLLLAVAALLGALAAGILRDGRPAAAPHAPAAGIAAPADAPVVPGTLPDGRAHLDDEPSLHALPRDPRLHRQVTAVILSMDAHGRPPKGVAQGGRRDGRRGLFENIEGRLPAQPRGYYAESDVWPRGRRGRGPERLVFGREGEVFYSPDHYRTFVRIR